MPTGNEVDDYLTNKVRVLEEAIRKHRDQHGDDRCWRDDEELYKVLPEGYTPPERDVAVEINNCLRFIACRKNPAIEYISPEKEIERLNEQTMGLMMISLEQGELLKKQQAIIKKLRGALSSYRMSRKALEELRFGEDEGEPE